MQKIQISTDAISSTTLQIGFEGENEHTQVVIYCSNIFSNYPDAVATMVIKPPVGSMYPKTITKDGVKVLWTVTDSDCASSGAGQYQLTFTDNGEVIKTYIGNFNIRSSLIANGEPPEPVEDWLQEAGNALSELENISASATTLAAGSSATAEITEVNGHKNIEIGVPKGASMEDTTVTGSTPTITGVANTRYICGVVSSISITAPQTGMIDVRFTSGSTATVLTTSGIIFPPWFVTTLESNKVYEINVLDGYGVVAEWDLTI